LPTPYGLLVPRSIVPVGNSRTVPWTRCAPLAALVVVSAPRHTAMGVHIPSAGAPPSGAQRQRWLPSSHQPVRLRTRRACARAQCQSRIPTSSQTPPHAVPHLRRRLCPLPPVHCLLSTVDPAPAAPHRACRSRMATWRTYKQSTTHVNAQSRSTHLRSTHTRTQCACVCACKPCCLVCAPTSAGSLPKHQTCGDRCSRLSCVRR